MNLQRRFLVAAWCVVCLILPLSLSAHGPSENHKETAEHDEAAMRAQHERMGNFREAMQNISEAIVLSNIKLAGENVDRLASAIKGYEKDAPHKNVTKAKEFYAFYIELGKRTERMKASIRSNDLSNAAVSYGQVLAVCVSCHKKFRD